MSSHVKKTDPSAGARAESSIDAVAQALQAEALEPLAQIVEALDLHFWMVDPA